MPPKRLFFSYLRHVYSTKTFIIPVIFFSILYNISKFFELNVVEQRTMSLENGTVLSAEDFLNRTTLSTEEMETFNVTYILQPTPLRLISLYITIYILWINLIFNILGPFVVLAVLNHIVSTSSQGQVEGS